MALKSLLEDRLYFRKAEITSKDFLQLCFVTREPIRSKMKPTECYAFTHKTFQEYFSALYLANEVLTGSKGSEALLLKVSPEDNWQVWKFLLPLVAMKDEERAVFLFSCLGGAVSRHSIPEVSDITQTTQFENSIKPFFPHSCSSEVDITAPSLDDDDRWSGYAPVRRAIDLIAYCEEFQEVLNDCQRKMLLKLAECIPLDNFRMYKESSRFLLAFSEYLSGSCTLTKLHIDGCCTDYSNRGFIALAQALSTNCVLTHLDLGYNDIRDEITVALGKALESNTTLIYLNLTNYPRRRDPIGPPGASALARALLKNSTLQCLDLESNSIRDPGALAFADALRTNSCLSHLDLFKNDIGDLGTEAICRALQPSHVMTYLILGGDTIGDSGVEALAIVLKSPATQLACLGLMECKITSLSVETLAGALQTNRSLTHLNLEGSLCFCSAAALVRALQSNRTLTHLNLSRNYINDSEAVLLGETLRNQNNTLTYLNL